MGFLTDIIRENRSGNTLASLKNPPGVLVNMLGAQATKSGSNVNERLALSLTSVWACVKIIAWTMASLPLHTYRKLDPRGKERATDQLIYKILHDTPNGEQTSFQYRSLTSVHQNLWGAGISEIEFDRFGYPVALWPLPPWRVTPKRDRNKELVYEVNLETQTYYLRPYQVVCFESLSTSQDYWLTPIGVHRETIGAAMAVKEFGARTFGQGTNPSGILTGLKFKNKDNEKEALLAIKEGYEGLSNSHRIMALEEGVKFERIGLPPQDAQYLETKKFDIAEIARIYNVPLHLLQDHEKSTSWGTGLEEMNLGFVTFTLRPYLVQWEQELKRKLIFDEKLFVEFLIEGLLRGKMKERFESYKIGINNSFMCPDQIAEIENWNPIPNGNTYWAPVNMQPVEKALMAEPKQPNATSQDNKEQEE
jgi:HK97 family phage portal protein